MLRQETKCKRGSDRKFSQPRPPGGAAFHCTRSYAHTLERSSSEFVTQQVSPLACSRQSQHVRHYAERNYFARVFAHKLRSSRSAPVSKASVLASRVHTLGLQHSMFFTSCCFAHGNIGKARKQMKGQGLGRNERGTTQLVSAAFFYCLRLREESAAK